ncbi:uncharacterized protein [Montipora foliosa]|uniref:uncharacterized protein n=1 Tax=Montipora foliosa TaxID=591990 RepID=UPI0035F10922
MVGARILDRGSTGMTRLNFAVLCWYLWFTRAMLEASCSDKGFYIICWGIKKTGGCQTDFAVESCQKTCDLCPATSVHPPSAEEVEHVSTTTRPTTHAIPQCGGQNLALPISRGLIVDHKLQGLVIWAHSVLSELHCEDTCLRFPACLAYNYRYSGVMEQRVCELMNKVTNVTNIRGYCCRFFERDRVQKLLLGSQQCSG